MSTNSLHGRIAAVTGASAGIGEAIARTLHAHGASVVINARRRDKLVAVGASIGARVACVDGDASTTDVISRILDHARATFGGGTRQADIVVVNAGRGLKGSVLDSDQAQWDEMVRTNVIGAANLIREAGNRLSGAAGPRDIIVIGSIVGKHVSPFSSMYGSTKFAVHGMVEGVRRELGPKGVRVTLIAPGFVTSEFQGVAGYAPEWYSGVVDKIGPVLVPDDVARLVAFIASQPPHVHIGDVVIRPVRQEYP